MLNSKYFNSVFVVLIILLSTLLLNTVLAGHEDPDEAEGDLESLFDILETTKEQMNRSLERALEVNYTLERKEEDTFADHESLKRSEEIAVDIEENLSGPDSVLEDIRGEVESAEYLDEYFVPFQSTSANLTRYAKSHSYMVSNLTLIGRMIEGSLNESDYGGETMGGLIANSLNHLELMNNTLKSMDEIVREIDFLDLDRLETSVEENEDLISKYEILLGQLKENEEPTALTIYGLEVGHPGAGIDISGYHIHEGNETTGAEIQIFKNEEEIDKVLTDNGSYEYTYNISWDRDLNKTLTFRAEVELEGKKIRSRNLTIDIVPYTSSLELEKEKDLYYNETVEIFGVFKTPADVNLSEIDLSIYKNDTFAGITNLTSDGFFELKNNSKEFRWGRTELSLKYPGNRTISPVSKTISFEVSIPTEIVDLTHPEVIRKDRTDEFALNGKLLNALSGEGIEGQNLSISLNGEVVGSVETGAGGNFTFVFSADQELESGHHVLNVYFEGTEKFRDVRTEDIQIDVEEEEPFWKSYTFISMIAVLIAVALILLYVLTGEEEKEEEEGVKEKIREPSSKISIPSASSSEDIPAAYRNFLDILQSSGFIDFSKGKTHQELEREISSHPKLKDLENHVRYVTDRFEKVLFTDKSISSSEIEKFNSSISRLTEEVSP
ncbi:MAG: hypothetical protein V5A88_00395 [Candidatus Thermoplasmatota archaeon]